MLMPASVDAEQGTYALGVSEQLLRAAGMDDAAAVQHHNLLRDARDDGEVLLDEEAVRRLLGVHAEVPSATTASLEGQP